MDGEVLFMDEQIKWFLKAESIGEDAVKIVYFYWIQANEWEPMKSQLGSYLCLMWILIDSLVLVLGLQLVKNT